MFKVETSCVAVFSPVFSGDAMSRRDGRVRAVMDIVRSERMRLEA